MTTPPVSDDEFYAQFRQGLEQYPEQPEDPAVWQRMKQVLDAEAQLLARQQRRRRWFGGSLALLLLLSLLFWTVLRYPAASPSANGGPVPSSGQRNLAQTTGPTRAPLACGGSTNAAVALGQQTNKATHPETPSAHSLANGFDSAQIGASRSGGLVSSPSSSSFRLPVNPQKAPLPKSYIEGSPRSPQQVSTAHPSLMAATDRRQRSWHRDEQSRATPFPVTAAATSATSRHSLSPPPAEESTTFRSTDKRRVPRKHSPSQSHAVPRPVPATAGGAAFATSAARAADAGALTPLAFRLAALLELRTAPPESLVTVALAASSPFADTASHPWPPLAAYRLRLGLVGAPELSTVRADRLVAPGSNLGAQLDYLLAPRWHLNVGYLQTVKRYAARGTDYHPPAGYVPPHSTWRIDDVNANCRIADVPINLRYDWWQRTNHQLFVSAGLSSLFMQREVYTYNYEQISGTTRPATDVEVVSGSRHVLQILNLSAGYERAVSRRWTVQAEPYLKLPLGGVGFGAVRLSSAGVFFSLRYGLLPARP